MALPDKPAVPWCHPSPETIVGAPDTFDPTSFKTKLTIELGAVRIKFVKSQTEGVNIYARLKGRTAWSFLARDTSSPCVDTGRSPPPRCR